MAPNITSQTLLLSAEAEVDQSDQKRESSNYSSSDARFREILVEEQYKWKISWRNVIAFIYLHAISLYGLFLLLTGQVRLITFLWSEFSFLEPFDHRIQDSQGSFNFLFFFFLFIFRCPCGRFLCSGSDGWSSQVVGTQSLQSQMAVETDFGHISNDGVSGNKFYIF